MNTQIRNPFRVALGQMRRTFVLVGLFSAGVNILMLTGPMFMLQVYDRVLASGSFATLQGLFIIVVVLYGFLGFYDFLRTRLLSRAGYKLDKTVGRHAFDIWVRSGADTKSKLARPLSDLSVVRGFMASPSMLGFFDLPWIPFYLAIVFFVHPWLGYLAITGSLVVISLALINQFVTRKPFAQAMSMDGTESFFVEQSRKNADAIIPLGMLGPLQKKWEQMHAAGLATGQVGSERGEGFAATSKAFRMLLQSSLLALGGYLALKQEISPGMIVATSIIAGRALAPVDQVIGQWRNVVRAREAHKRLKETLDVLERQKQHVQLPEPIGKLDLRGVTKFNMMDGDTSERPPILQNISFALEPGDALGVIGSSASGKSTLARILVGGWMPDRGEVRLDGATYDQWEPDDLGKFIGYLPQSLELLAGSIKDNIARFDPEASDDAVIEAAQTAGVHEMILQLPDGYATQLGYGVPPLSGGQVQRVGLARAIYGMPKIVVLDEPNSNLDQSGDAALAKAILHLRQAGSTVVVMAHRPSAIEAVNKVMVLREGAIVEFGDKDEVLRKATRPAAVVQGGQGLERAS